MWARSVEPATGTRAVMGCVPLQAGCSCGTLTGTHREELLLHHRYDARAPAQIIAHYASRLEHRDHVPESCVPTWGWRRHAGGAQRRRCCGRPRVCSGCTRWSPGCSGAAARGEARAGGVSCRGKEGVGFSDALCAPFAAGCGRKPFWPRGRCPAREFEETARTLCANCCLPHLLPQLESRRIGSSRAEVFPSIRQERSSAPPRLGRAPTGRPTRASRILKFPSGKVQRRERLGGCSSTTTAPRPEPTHYH